MQESLDSEGSRCSKENNVSYNLTVWHSSSERLGISKTFKNFESSIPTSEGLKLPMGTFLPPSQSPQPLSIRNYCSYHCHLDYIYQVLFCSNRVIWERFAPHLFLSIAITERLGLCDTVLIQPENLSLVTLRIVPLSPVVHQHLITE